MSNDANEAAAKIIAAVTLATLTEARKGFDTGWAAACEAIEALAAKPEINTMTASDALRMCVCALEDVKNIQRSNGG